MKTRFIVDGMLGSLSRKLRIFGYDTLYDVNFVDREILEIAENEDRVILTSDQRLAERAAGRKLRCILLSGESDEERLVAVIRGTRGEVSLIPAEARCPVCNGEVGLVGRDGVVGAVPEGVLVRQEKFYRCGSCGKVYWIGGHWKRLHELAENLGRRVQQA
jgi:uncharacterized protein with PIN domain